MLECTPDVEKPFVDRVAGLIYEAGDTSCAQQVRPIRTVAAFAERVEQVAPAKPVDANAGTEADLRIASAAAETVGDVLARFFVNYYGSGVGLRGGTFSLEQTGTGHDIQLQDVRWASDLGVSGTVRWDQSTGLIRADLNVEGPDDSNGRLTLRWNDRETDALVRISGDIRRRAIQAERLAP